MIRTEVVTRVAPLGLRFWDDLLGDLVRDGLVVTAWPSETNARRSTAQVNRSGVWLFHGLPGMRSFEHGTGDDLYWDSVQRATDPALRPLRPFTVQIEDPTGRFLPVRLDVKLPVRWLYDWSQAAPEEGRSLPASGAPREAIPLFSAPWRFSVGRAVVRGELLDVTTHRGIAGAFVEAFVEGHRVGRGLADPNGKVLVTFPYPEPDGLLSGSPLGSPPGGGRPSDWSWEVTLRIRATPPPRDPPQEPPTLVDVFSQPVATVLSHASPEVTLGAVRLEYGRDLVVSSVDAPGRRLWVAATP